MVIKVTDCRETEDELMRTMLEATAAFVNCVAGVNGDNPTEPTPADFEGVVSALQSSDGEFIGDVVEGENKFGKQLKLSGLSAELKSLVIDLEFPTAA